MPIGDSTKRESRTGGREATLGVIEGRFALSVGLPSTAAPPGWKWAPLGALAQLESGHTPSRKHSEYWNGGVPWIGIKDAVDNHGRTIRDTYQHISELGLANSSARLLPERTVCLSRTASVGYVVVMGRPMATSQDFVNWVCGPALVPEFLKYILLAERESLLRFASGTTHQTIYYPEAKALHILLPPLSEQKRILDVLGALDDKIELNERTNETLDALARSLFKSWFFDFDPVFARSKGIQEVGVSAATAALFPTEFQETEFGRTPKGWTIAELGDWVTLQRGNTYKSALLRLPGPYLLGLASIRRDGGFRADALRSYGGESPEKLMLRPGDLYVSLKDVTQSGDLLGAAARVPAWLRAGRLTQDTVRLDFAGVDAPWRRAFTYGLLRTPRYREYCRGRAIGTTNLSLARTDFLAFPFVAPPPEILRRLMTILGPLTSRVEDMDQSKSLASIRDTLLPKLISGQVRVRDAEKTVGQAV